MRHQFALTLSNCVVAFSKATAKCCPMREAWDSFQVEDVGRKAKFKSGCPNKQNEAQIMQLTSVLDLCTYIETSSPNLINQYRYNFVFASFKLLPIMAWHVFCLTAQVDDFLADLGAQKARNMCQYSPREIPCFFMFFPLLLIMWWPVQKEKRALGRVELLNGLKKRIQCIRLIALCSLIQRGNIVKHRDQRT